MECKADGARKQRTTKLRKDVMEDLNKLGIEEWRIVAMESWKKMLREAKARTGL